MNRTIQKLSLLEYAKERVEMLKKIDNDIILYYHYESIEQELSEEIYNLSDSKIKSNRSNFNNKF